MAGKIGGSLVAILLVIGIFVGGFWAGRSWQPGAPPSASGGEEEVQVAVVRGQGRLEPASGIIDIGGLPGEKIQQTFVHQPGQPVAAGEPIAVLAGSAVRQAELEVAEARVREAVARKEAELRTAQIKVTSAELAVEKARLELDQERRRRELIIAPQAQQLQTARNQLERLTRLRQSETTATAVSEFDIEQQDLLVRKIEDTIAQSTHDIDGVILGGELALRAANNDLLAAQSALENLDVTIPLESLQASLQLARSMADQAKIQSPIDGVVLDVLVREGERIGNTPIVQLGDTKNMICVVEVNEIHLRLVNPGQSATITSPALDQPLQGTVVEKGLVVGAPGLSAADPFQRRDRRVGTVRIQLNDTAAQVASRYINLQVDVAIDVVTPGQHVLTRSQPTRDLAVER